MHFAQPNLVPKSENNAQIRPLIRSVIILHFSVVRGNNSIVLHPFALFRSAHRLPGRAGEAERAHSLQPAPTVRSYYTYWGGTIVVTPPMCPNLSPVPIIRT